MDFESLLQEAIEADKAYQEAMAGGYHIPSPTKMGFKPDPIGDTGFEKKGPVGGSDDLDERVVFTKAMSKKLKQLKKDLKGYAGGVASIRGGYKGTGGRRDRLQTWVRFKEGGGHYKGTTIDIWIDSDTVSLGGVMHTGSGVIVTKGKTPDEVYKKVLPLMKAHVKASLGEERGSMDFESLLQEAIEFDNAYQEAFIGSTGYNVPSPKEMGFVSSPELVVLQDELDRLEKKGRAAAKRISGGSKDPFDHLLPSEWERAQEIIAQISAISGGAKGAKARAMAKRAMRRAIAQKKRASKKTEGVALDPFGKIVTTSIQEELISVGGSRLAEAFTEGLDQRLYVVDEVPWDNEELDEEFKVPPPSKFGFKLSPVARTMTKGKYVDVGLGPSNVTLGDIAGAVADIMQKGVTFVRDPAGVIKQLDPSLRNFSSLIGAAVSDEFVHMLNKNAEFLGFARGEGDPREKLMFDALQDAPKIRKARILVKPVQGKTGAGYKIKMTPTLEDYFKKHSKVFSDWNADIERARKAKREEFEVPWDDEESLEEAYYGRFQTGRFRTPKPGLMGRRFEAALKKGYVDFGLIDRRNASSLSKGHVASSLVAAMKNGVGYIRDPENILSTLGWSLDDVAREVKNNLFGHYWEEQSYASEREDPDEVDRLERMKWAVDKAKVTFAPVKGKTGKGYRFVMKPSQEQIEKMA